MNSYLFYKPYTTCRWRENLGRKKLTKKVKNSMKIFCLVFDAWVAKNSVKPVNNSPNQNKTGFNNFPSDTKKSKNR